MPGRTRARPRRPIWNSSASGPGPCSRRPGADLPGRLASAEGGGPPGAPRGLGRIPGRALPARPEGARDARSRGLPRREGRVPDPAGRPDDRQRLRAGLAREAPGDPRGPRPLAGAKQDPVVQSRCIGAAKLGFFVLAVDAFGAGERGVGKALGEYHGEMTAATLLPVGLPLAGLQVYENLRAVDYLRTRPEVDGERIGITGASGGGNQSMYAGAWDERLRAVVPGLLGRELPVVPRDRLLPVRARPRGPPVHRGVGRPRPRRPPGAHGHQRDPGRHPVLGRRGREVAGARRPGLPALLPARLLRHTVFESGHDYSRPMREAVYGWMTLHLKGEGDGSPVAEPAIATEDPEALRCYPGESRPDDWMTLPRFAAAEGRKLLASRPGPKDAAGWREIGDGLRTALVEKVFGGFPVADPDLAEVRARRGPARPAHPLPAGAGPGADGPGRGGGREGRRRSRS